MGCPFSISYMPQLLQLHEESRIPTWNSRSCWISLLNRVSILDLVLDMKSLASFEWPSSRSPEVRLKSAMALLLSGILYWQAINILVWIFIFPSVEWYTIAKTCWYAVVEILRLRTGCSKVKHFKEPLPSRSEIEIIMQHILLCLRPLIQRILLGWIHINPTATLFEMPSLCDVWSY